MVKIKFYDPEVIFQDDGNPEGMAGETNIKLAASFVHSRNRGKCFQCNSQHDRFDRPDKNAGAALLYKEDGVSLYPISAHLNKEYHCISHGQKDFKKFTPKIGDFEATSYGHSERMLMRDILDDLVLAEDPGEWDLVPSNHYRSPNPKEQECEILKYLLDNAWIFKQYLESKQIIVKMWSERPACTEEGNMMAKIGGGNCTRFMKDICPERSQYGFIVKEYKRSDNQNGAPKVKEAIDKFASAYKAYMKGVCNKTSL